MITIIITCSFNKFFPIKWACMKSCNSINGGYVSYTTSSFDKIKYYNFINNNVHVY